MSSLLTLATELIRRPSVSPADEGCQMVLAEKLESLGFSVEHLPFGDVSNLWATRGSGKPLLCFAGHTDVVPPGDISSWDTDPFVPEVRNGHLYGRGAADMKGSLAAMTDASDHFLEKHPDHQGTLAFLITSDEEADAVDGTVRVMETLHKRGIEIDHCLIGEPSSTDRLGDVVRNGRRGSLNGTLRVRGTLGHVAYPEKACNPIHAFLPALTELSQTSWDSGNDYFPPTSFQISNINAGTGATNVIPGDLQVLFNFRFSTETTAAQLQAKTEAIFNRHFQDYDLDWQLSGNPFLTEAGDFTCAVGDSVESVMGYRPELSTGGGTSDGRFIAPYGTDVVELGPRNATIHKINECVSVQELEDMSRICEQLIEKILL